jgi:uncharacterized protein YbjT (DUF2867 family)
MNVILFGATGMVGQGALRECLLDPSVERVLAVGRSPSGQRHDKLRDLVHQPLDDLSPVAGELAGYDACLFCLGTSSAGMSEADYRKVTYDLTLSVARTLLAVNPTMTFVYVSGQGTNTKGRAMWARVKGETEDALLALAPDGAYMFRPGFIMPLHGIVTKTRLYRVFYAILGPLYPLLKWLSPDLVTTTETVGRAMLSVARRENRDGNPKHVPQVLEMPDINAAGSGTPLLGAR